MFILHVSDNKILHFAATDQNLEWDSEYPLQDIDPGILDANKSYHARLVLRLGHKSDAGHFQLENGNKYKYRFVLIR